MQGLFPWYKHSNIHTTRNSYFVAVDHTAIFRIIFRSAEDGSARQGRNVKSTANLSINEMHFSIFWLMPVCCWLVFSFVTAADCRGLTFRDSEIQRLETNTCLLTLQHPNNIEPFPCRWQHFWNTLYKCNVLAMCWICRSSHVPDSWLLSDQ